MDLASFGAGGFGRELLSVCRETSGVGDILFTVDESPIGRVMVRGHLVVSTASVMNGDHGARRIVVALGDSLARRRVVERFTAAGYRFHTVSAASHINMGGNDIGEGAVFCDRTMVTADVRIGAHFQCNIFSYVAHDCWIGDFVTFAPRVSCNGGVTIGDGAYIGTGAVLRPNVTIGAGAYVGMGAVVVKDVAPGDVVIGNPARARAA